MSVIQLPLRWPESDSLKSIARNGNPMIQGRVLSVTIHSGLESPTSIADSVNVLPEGIEGNARHSLSRAIYAYPSEHYPFWKTVRAQAQVAGWDEEPPAGLLGENLTLAGLIESQAFIGDLLQFPDCALAISEPRLPGDELNASVGFDHGKKLMLQSGWCGFYLAVRVPGRIKAGDSFQLMPGPRNVGIAELFRARLTPGRN